MNINITRQIIRRWRRFASRSSFNCTSDTSNFSLNLFDAGTVRLISPNTCDFNAAGLSLTILDEDFEAKEVGNLNLYKRKTNKRSMFLNRKNKNFLGEHL